LLMILRLLCGLLEVCDRDLVVGMEDHFRLRFLHLDASSSRCRCWLRSSFGITGGVPFLPAASRVHCVAFSG
jgi:hypothetical protein